MRTLPIVDEAKREREKRNDKRETFLFKLTIQNAILLGQPGLGP